MPRVETPRHIRWTRAGWLLLGLLVVLPVASCGKAASSPSASSGASSPAVVESSASPTGQPPRLAHVFLILEENKDYAQIVGSQVAPYINGLIGRYALATDYHALFHPSLPNYIALTSGSNYGITGDVPAVGNELAVTNIADLIEASGRTWREYAESLPSAGFAVDTAEYAVRHNPFVYYKDIAGNAQRERTHIVPLARLATDLSSAQTTPDYAFITPNVLDDMHSGTDPVAAGDRWLARTVPLILGSPAFKTSTSLLIVTWDEDLGAPGNHIPTILCGNAVKPGYRSGRRYDHYSLLHTIEAAWQLAPMTANDAHAPTMNEFFK